MTNTKQLAVASIKQGWELTKQHLGKILLFQVVYFLISIVLSSLSEGFGATNNGGLSLLMLIIQMGVNTLIGVGYIKFFFNIYDKKEAGLKDLYLHKNYFWGYLGLSILLGIAVVIPMLIGGAGLMALMGTSTTIGGIIAFVGVLVGIYVAIVLSQSMYLLIDTNTGIVASLKQSMQLMKIKGVKAEYILLGLLNVLVTLLGILALLIGLLVAMPVVMLAQIHFYRELSKSMTKKA